MKKLLTRAFNNDFVRGGFILTFSNFAIGFLNYISNFLTGQALGPVLYGEISTLFAYSFILSVPIAVVSTLVIQKISSRQKNKQFYALSLESFFINKIHKLWIVFILILLAIPIIPKITNLSLLTAYSLIPLTLLAFFAAFYNASLLGLRMFLLFSLIGIAASAIRLIGTFIAFLGIGGINTIVMASFASAIFFLFANYILFHKKIGKQDITKVTVINKRLLQVLLDHQVILYILSTLAFAVYNNFDIIFVKKYFSPSDTGIYSSWSLFAKIIVYSLSPLASVSFIYFSSHIGKKLQRFTLFLTLILLSIVGIAGYLFYSLLGPQIVQLLYGNKFLPVIPFLGQASIFGFLYVAIMFINGYFMAKKSRFAYIFVFFLPIYTVGLFFITRDLSSLIKYIISFSAFIVFLYLAAYIMNIPRKNFIEDKKVV